MISVSRSLGTALLVISCLFGHMAFSADADADKTALAVEALSRLQGVDLNANPKLKETVLRVLERTHGTPSFVKLVRQFNLIDQNAGLLDVATAQPAGESGIEAMKMILASGDTSLVEHLLASTNTVAAAAVAEVLGNTGDRQAVKLLVPLVADSKRDAAVRRQSVKALTRTSDGAKELLALARADRLGDDVKFVASSELNSARWPEIKAEAARILPLPPSQNSEPLPRVADLVQRKGDPANGAKVYARASPGCANCH